MCRLCLGAWTDHGERTGGFYACNRYEAAKQEGAVLELAKLCLPHLKHIILIVLDTFQFCCLLYLFFFCLVV